MDESGRNCVVHVRPRWRPITLLFWLLPAVSAAAMPLLATQAYAAAPALIALDNCATGWDEPWGITLSITFWATVIVCVALTIRAGIGGRPLEVVLGILVTPALFVYYFFISWQAFGAYGWHCGE